MEGALESNMRYSSFVVFKVYNFGTPGRSSLTRDVYIF
jgi:hypothetical protein